MHILLTFPFSLGIPGGGTFAFLQTARHLKAAGATVTAMPLYSRGPKTFFRRSVPMIKDGRLQVTSLREFDIEVIQVPANPISFAFDGASMRTAVSNYIFQHAVDAVISWHHEGVSLGKICEENKIVFVMRAVGNYEQIVQHVKGRFWSTITFQMLKRAFTQANTIWAPSKFTSHEISDVFKIKAEKIQVIPEGINPIFQSIRRIQQEADQVNKFIFIGSWTLFKGVFDAISAFGELAKQGVTDWEFRIIGWGDEDKVRKAIKDNDIIDRVKVVGRLEHTELLKEMESAYALVNPSYIESFALAVHEAQLGGLPVIAYDTGAIPEIIEDQKTGWLVPSRRIDLLTEAIKDSMKEPERTNNMGMNGRKKFLNRYTWSKTTQMMLDDIVRNKEK